MTRIEKLTPDLNPDQLRSKIKEISERLSKATNIPMETKFKIISQMNKLQHNLYGRPERFLTESQIYDTLQKIERTLNKCDENQLKKLINEEIKKIKIVTNPFDLKILEEKGYLVLDDSTKTADEKIEDLNTLIIKISENDIAKIKDTYNLDETLTNLSKSIHNNDISRGKVIFKEIVSQAISILSLEQEK